LFQKRLFFDFF